MKSHLKFYSLHNELKKDGLRMGQRFCNMFIKESWPDLFYQENERKAIKLIYQWLKEKHYYYELPTEIKREKNYLTSCIGVDRKQHVCYPWKDETECGVKILKKKMTDSDYTEHFGCYECTY